MFNVPNGPIDEAGWRRKPCPQRPWLYLHTLDLIQCPEDGDQSHVYKSENSHTVRCKLSSLLRNHCKPCGHSTQSIV